MPACFDLGRLRNILADNFPKGAPPAGALFGRYLALQGGVAYKRAWVEWADYVLQSLDAPAIAGLDPVIPLGA